MTPDARSRGRPLIPRVGLADLVKDALLGPEDVGNAYRVVAQRL